MEELGKLLIEKNLSICSAESLTGGLFASKLVGVSGISKVFKGSIVCYQDEVKINVLNVDKKTIDSLGAVSEECAYKMCKNVREIFKSDIGVSFTGNAGPLPSEGKEVGLVYIGVDFKGEIEVVTCHFNGDREMIRNACLLKAKEIILKKI